MLRSLLINQVFTHGVWSTGNTIATQSEAILENPC